jgi:hypothetical protein
MLRELDDDEDLLEGLQTPPEHTESLEAGTHEEAGVEGL